MREGVNKVALCLFEHNEKAYHAAVRMMDQYGKAAIVHPTGTGKSHIASKMPIVEAAVRGVLPTPNYVTTVYQYQKTLAKYQARVGQPVGTGSSGSGTPARILKKAALF